MKSGDRFVAGQLHIERTEHREGPPIVYTVMTGHSAKLFTDHKDILRWVKWPSKTPTGDALREWLASFDEKPETPTPEPDWAKVKREVHAAADPITGEEIAHDDKMHNTEMVFKRFCKS